MLFEAKSGGGKVASGTSWSMEVGGAKRIDFQAIRATVSLHDVISRDLGEPDRGNRWVCPFHAGAANANLSVTSDDRTYRCWSCGAKGDVFDYISQRDGITVAEAARQLDPFADQQSERPRRPVQRPKPQPAPTARPAWEDSTWQAAAEKIISKAEENLWNDGTSGGPLAWLHNRGLDGSTIRRFRLGFLPRGVDSVPLEVLADREGRPQPIRARRGITIPWGNPAGDPSWVGCQVRCLTPEFTNPTPKYVAFRGSERGHAYPNGHVVPGLPALVCEGEFDALLAWQELGAVVNVLTVGGVSQNPQRDALDILHASPAWLLAFDHDMNKAGDNAARKFSSLAPHKCRRLWLPGVANDLTEFHQSGGNLLGWLESEFIRFGWPWPSVPVATDPSAWRMQAAALPWEHWLEWRRRTAELTASAFDSDAIHAAERQALEVLFVAKEIASQ